MNEQEKTKKLEMLPWQALFDLAISKEIDENDIKGKEKSTIIFKIIHEALKNWAWISSGRICTMMMWHDL